ncbi:hypothetical protein RN001_005970 [Aquatica leii]|uniref:SAM domain-containing protein n=1 Tax=Aquatica leii TaxID=1421715 RepID=A0AAN7PKK8_9COLE|nr:hypothetical protein RN001_005970 [Aquatica leii]
MEEKLNQWDLADLIPIFTEHKIDEESFALLNETYIEKLVPAVGLQLKLKRRLQEYLEKDSIEILADTASTNNTFLTSSYEASITDKSDVITIESKLVEEQSSSRTSNTSGSTSTVDNFLQTFQESNTYDLKGLLNCSNEGIKILKHYEIHNELKRKLLVDLIINRELRDNPDKRIPGERFLLIAESICKVFPVESPRTYFIPGYRDYKGKNISAHGQLWNKYINTRTIYRNLNIIPKPKNKNSFSNIDFKRSDEPLDDIILESICWLQKNIHPWIKVEEFWKVTCTSRLKTYINEKTEIHAYFKLYPCLGEPLGYSLLLLDFEHTYPNKANLLFTEWPLIYKNLINLSRRKKCPILEAIIKKHLDQNYSEDENRRYIEENVAFIIFPLLFPNIKGY